MENQALTSSSQAPSEPTSMTSLEIATVTGKQHKNVLRDIDNLLEDLGSELSRGFKSSTYLDSNNTSRRLFVLDRDSTYCLMAGYDGKARMKIVKRWQELESRALAAPSAKEMETRILASVMEQVKTILEAPKQTRKRLPAPKKEFLSLEDLASRLGFYIQELLSIGRKVPAPYMIEAILVDAGYLVRDSSISLTPTPEAKGNYKRSRGRYPTTQWDYEFVRNLVESRK